MIRCSLLAWLALCLSSLSASALEIKNIRPSYGPLGATRTNTRCVPGDSLFITYDIEGLRIHNKTFRANYTTIFEFIGPAGESILKKPNTNDVALPLGGTRMPGDLFVIVPRSQKPGKHKVKLTVTDLLAKETKSFEYPFDVVAPEFAFVGVSAKAVGFPGENYVATFAVVDMVLDANKKPDVVIGMRILDAGGKNTVSPPIFSNLPKDLPDEIDLQKENFVPMQFPIYLNRSGVFLVEVVAQDKLSKKDIQLRYTLTVIETGK